MTYNGWLSIERKTIRRLRMRHPLTRYSILANNGRELDAFGNLSVALNAYRDREEYPTAVVLLDMATGRIIAETVNHR